MVYVDGILTTLDAVVNGYYTESEWVETPMTDEELEEYYEGVLGYDVDVITTEEGVVIGHYVSIAGGEPIYVTTNPDKIATPGEWVTTETFVTFLTLDFDDYGDEAVLKINAHESIIPGIDCITLTVNNNQISAVFTRNDEFVGNATLSVTDTGLSVEVNNATETVFQAGVEFIDNAEGEDFIRVEYQGIEVIYGYKVDENGVKFAIYNNGDEVVALFEAVKNDSSVVLTSVLGPKGDELLSAVVTFTVAEDELVIDIDLDHLLIYQMISEILFEKCYIEFDGAITIKVA